MLYCARKPLLSALVGAQFVIFDFKLLLILFIFFALGWLSSNTVCSLSKHWEQYPLTFLKWLFSMS